VTTAELRPASTVLVLRDAPGGPQVFMVRRHHGNEFMAGAYVFPGGRVDGADRAAAGADWCDGADAAAARLAGVPDADALAFLVAAARELFEEAGVLLARDSAGRFVELADPAAHARVTGMRTEVHRDARSFPGVLRAHGLRLALDALVPFAHWVTPPLDIRRFDTRFFLAPMPPAQRPAHDDTETTESMWVSPAEAIRLCEAGTIVLPPPTWTSLRELEGFDTTAAAFDWAARRRVVRREPLMTSADGERLVLLPGDPSCPDDWPEPPPRETRFVKTDGGWKAVR
jgi:8-oxo-dGTP pyrophosphatase MutT (NUDIX family)